MSKNKECYVSKNKGRTGVAATIQHRAIDLKTFWRLERCFHLRISKHHKTVKLPRYHKFAQSCGGLWIWPMAMGWIWGQWWVQSWGWVQLSVISLRSRRVRAGGQPGWGRSRGGDTLRVRSTTQTRTLRGRIVYYGPNTRTGQRQHRATPPHHL